MPFQRAPCRLFLHACSIANQDYFRPTVEPSNISREGALILSPLPAPFPSTIWVRNRHTGTVSAARLVRPSERSATGHYALGLELLDDTLDTFWGPQYVWTPA